MAPQPQTKLPLPGSSARSFFHPLLPLVFLLYCAVQHFCWFQITPPLPPLIHGEADFGIGAQATVESLLYSRRPQPLIPRLPAKPLPPPVEEQPLHAQAQVAIIIDDLGFVREPTKAFWALEVPLTFAVLPWGRYSQDHAHEAHLRGQEVILHLPLEPLDPQTDPGPGALRSTFSPEQLRHQIRENLAAIPEISGVNNHMGSKGTQDRELMELVMAELKMADLFFVDSMTIHSSVAGSVAQEYSVPSAARDVFLDGGGPETIVIQIERLIEQAQAEGSAIGIAHTRPGVAEAIAAALPLFDAAGIELVHVSRLVK